MKKCEKCGQNLKNDAKFCPNCGAEVPESTPEAKTGGLPFNLESLKQNLNPEMLKKNFNPKALKQNPKRLGGVAAAAVTVIVLLVLLLSPSGMKITPEEYVTVKTYGLNGEGSVELAFDEDSFIDAIKEEKKLKPAQESELEGLLIAAEKYFAVSKSEGLTNGDKIKIKSSMPSDYLKKYGISVKNKGSEYTVAGLIDVQTVKLQDYYVMEFFGFEGYGELYYDIDYNRMYADVAELIRNVDNSQNAEQYIQSVLYGTLNSCVYQLNPDFSSNLSNGDSVTLNCVINEGVTRIEKYGILFEAEPQTFEVSGLEDVVTVNLEEYLDAEFSGYQGAGEVDAIVNQELLLAAMTELVPEDRNGYNATDIVDIITSYVYYEVGSTADKTEYLSNGDEVVISVSIEDGDRYAASMGIILEGAEKTLVVEGLQDTEELDLMDLLTITFTGTCPNIRIEREFNWEHPAANYVDWDSVNAIPYQIYAANGDVLEIALEADEEALLKNGYTVVNKSASLEISGLNTYDVVVESVDAFAEIAEAGAAEMYRYLFRREYDILQEMNDGVGSLLWPDVKMALSKIVKVYAEQSYYNYNKISFVYEYLIPIRSQNETVDWHSVYAVCVYTNVMQDAEGNYIFPENYWYNWYLNEEALEEGLADIEDDVSYEEGSERVRTEVVNEAAEEILIPGTMEEAELPESIVFEATEIPELDVTGAAVVVEYDGHRYYRFDTAVTWEEARSACEELGGTLASVTSWTEKCVIETLIDGGSLSDYWIGGTDSEKEGKWEWLDGEAFEYTAWQYGQPDNYRETEHYIQIGKYSSGEWNDAPNDTEDVGYIMEVSAPAGEEFEYLAEVNGLSGERYSDIEVHEKDSYGNDYYGVISYDASSDSWNQYQLDGKYDRLTGSISVYEDAASGVSIDFAVFGDGKLLYRQRAIGKQAAPIGIDLDVSGVQELLIATRNPGEYSNGYLLLGNAKLYAAEAPVEAEYVTENLNNLVLIDGCQYEETDYLWEDTFGKLHFGNVYLDGSSDAFALWNLDGNYTTFNTVISLGDRTAADAVLTIQIYGDDELLYEYEGFDRTVNAQEISLDVTGKQTLKIMTDAQEDSYNGYIYLSDNVLIGNLPVESTEIEIGKGQPLSELDEKIIGSNYYQYHESITDAKGITYEGTYVLDASYEAWVAFDLNGEYEMFSGLLSPYENTSMNASMTIGFFGDGRLLYEKNQISGWAEAEPFSVDVTGVKTLTIRTANYGGYSYGWLLLNNAAVTEAAEKTECEAYTRLNEIQMIDSSAMSYQDGLFMDTYGNLYDGALRFDTMQNGYSLYLLDGEYTAFSGVICAGNETETGHQMTIQIYADDELIFEQAELSRQSMAVPFIVDVAGVKNLKVSVSSQNGRYDGYLFLTNNQLK